MKPQIPVTLLINSSIIPPLNGETAFIRLPANSGHGHADGATCVACAAQTDIRALLHNLLEEQKRGLRPAFGAVVVDASALTDPQQAVLALTGKLPAQALRDHVVARSFYLVETV